MSTFAKQLLGLQRYVLSGETVGVGSIVGSRGFTRSQRLKVYREAYYLRLLEALTATFPTLKAMLGDDQFRHLTRVYVDAFPSNHFSVRQYGHKLPWYIRHRSALPQRPALAEIAEWEWAMAYAFDAADRDPPSPDSLAAMPAEDWPLVRFEFHDSLFHVSTRWNTVDVWRALSHEEPPPSIEPIKAMQRWTVWRKGLKVLYVCPDTVELRALRLAEMGLTFAEICTGAPAEGTAESRALWCAQLIRRWVDRGWIVRLVRNPGTLHGH